MFHLGVKRVLLLLVFIGICFSIPACLIVGDDDDNDESERINYFNNTPYTVENYIDDVYRGSVDPFDSMTIYGDFEGTHKFYSRAIGINWTWDPMWRDLYDGETLNIYLDPP